jgi:glutamine transport system permease protein
MGFTFEWKVMIETFPLLLSGVKLTILITLVGLFFGFIIGAAAGLMKLSKHLFFRKLGGVYVESIRGTPLIVQVMFLYFGIPMAVGMRISPITAGIVAIAVNSGAYIAEIVRGAVQSIDVGQIEAGRSIGLTRTQTMRYIIWPQAFRRMIPPLGNQFIISLKDTSLLVVIGVAELTRVGQEIIAVNFRAFEVWLTVGLVYLMMTLSIARVLKMTEERLEKRTAR